MKKYVLVSAVLIGFSAYASISAAEPAEKTVCPQKNCVQCVNCPVAPCDSVCPEKCPVRPEECPAQCDAECPAECPAPCPRYGQDVPGERLAVCPGNPNGPQVGRGFDVNEGGVWERGCFQPGPGSQCRPCDNPRVCLSDGITLTAEQQAKADKLKEKHQKNAKKNKEKFDKKRSKLDNDRKKLREERRETMDNSRREFEREYLQILTPEQKNVYMQNKAKLEQRRERKSVNGRGFRGGHFPCAKVKREGFRGEKGRYGKEMPKVESNTQEKK